MFIIYKIYSKKFEQWFWTSIELIKTRKKGEKILKNVRKNVNLIHVDFAVKILPFFNYCQ